MIYETPQPTVRAPRRAGLGRWGLRLLALVIAIVSGLIVTFLSIGLGPSVRGIAERQGSKYIERPLHIGRIRALVGRGEFDITQIFSAGVGQGHGPRLPERFVHRNKSLQPMAYGANPPVTLWCASPFSCVPVSF